MTPAIIWLIVGVALIAAEVLGDFVLVMLGPSVGRAGSTLISDNPIIHVIVFAVARRR